MIAMLITSVMILGTTQPSTQPADSFPALRAKLMELTAMVESLQKENASLRSELAKWKVVQSPVDAAPIARKKLMDRAKSDGEKEIAKKADEEIQKAVSKGLITEGDANKIASGAVLVGMPYDLFMSIIAYRKLLAESEWHMTYEATVVGGSSPDTVVVTIRKDTNTVESVRLRFPN